MKESIILEGNTIYELDSDCLRCKTGGERTGGCGGAGAQSCAGPARNGGPVFLCLLILLAVKAARG